MLQEELKYHLRTELLQVSQGGNTFFIGVVPANFLLNTFTVNPVEYDYEKEASVMDNFPDMKDYFEKSLKEKKETMESKGFQRTADPKRAKQIAKFLDTEEYPFFPNSIITSLELGEYIKQNNEIKNDANFEKILADNKDFSVLFEMNDRFELYLTKRAKSVLIIDGQHRLEGLQQAGEVVKNYDLIVSFLLDFDRSVIAKQFYTINYSQKSVNKSLLYHLTGEFSQDLDEITFLHEAVKLLNETEKSPFFKRIKMLGSAPKYLSKEVRQKMTLSQAFLIDYLLYSIKNRKANSVIQPIFKYYFDNSKYDIVRFLISYFTAVRKIFPEWDYPEKSILSKTIGVGALLKVLNFLFIQLYFEAGLYEEPEEIKNIKSDLIVEKLSGIESTDLQSFSGGSSAGTVNQLKAEMIKNIKYFNYEKFMSYQKFEIFFKKEYALKFLDTL